MGHTRPRATVFRLLWRSFAARFAAASAALAILASSLAPGATAQTAAVSIPDTGLRAAIESALGKEPGEAITEGDMALMGILDASHAGIAQLDGLEHAVNLRALYLQGNSIADASSLANLARMQVLSLHSNAISEIDLTAMTDLTFVDLGNNDLTAIDLSGQRTRVGENARSSKLFALWLNNNRLTSVDVSGLTALRDRPDGTPHPNFVSLRLDRNQLTSVTGLADLPREVWSLRLEHNQLTSIDLRGAEHFHYVHLNDNPISDTSQLDGFTSMTDLHRLHFYDTDISAIDLSSFSRLERAFLNDNELASVDVTGLDSIQRAVAERQPHHAGHWAARRGRHPHLAQPEDQPPVLDRPVGAVQPAPALPERQPTHVGGLESRDPVGCPVAGQRLDFGWEHPRPRLPEPDHDPRPVAPVPHRSQAGR